MINLKTLISFAFNILSLANVANSDIDSNKSVSILMPNVDPKMAETYLCTSLQLDPEKQRYIVGFTPNASMNVVHHMILHGCNHPGRTELVWNCGDMELGNHQDFVSGNPCLDETNYLYAWARNAATVSLPEGVAFEIGKDTKIQSLVLQVHYADVTSFKNGYKDNSGVVLHFTETRQSKTAGVYLLGTSGHIPPTTTEYMDAACIVRDEKNFHPFAFRTHTHSLGHVVTGYQIRRDKNGIDQWTLIGKKNPMLPQTFYPVENNITVMPGDILAARCTMISNRAHTTYTGSTNDHEMCNFYIMYWIEGSTPLRHKVCFKDGPPEYRWNIGPPTLNNIPEMDASSI